METTYEFNEVTKEKLSRSIVRGDLGSGINYMKPIEEFIHIDFDKAEHVDVVCDWMSMPFVDETFDTLHSGETIEHIPEFKRDKTLREWNRIMKKGCVFTFTTPNLEYVIKATYEKLQPMEWTIGNLYGDRADYGHQHYYLYTKKTVMELLEKYGFGNFKFNDAWGAGEDSSQLQWLSATCYKMRNL